MGAAGSLAGVEALTTTEPLVLATGLHKAFGEGDGRVVALAGADLAVEAGELLVVAGPSGCGKSTLLQCLAGVLAPDEGTVTVRVGGGARDLAALDDDARTDLRGRRMGLVFQDANLLPALTVRENVEVPLMLQGRPAREVTAAVDEVLGQVGMLDRAGAFPAALSGGQRQRVALARALVHAPDLVLADEPTGALDSAAQDEVLGLLREVAAADGRAVVVVSHAPAVVAIADRVASMRDGRVLDPA